MALTRPSAGNGRFLEWKIRLFAVAAVLLLVGMARDLRLLVLLAGVVLAVAFVLRFFERNPGPGEPDETEAFDEAEDADDARSSSGAEDLPRTPPAEEGRAGS